MSYRIAGIDVHKKMLAVVVPDVEVDGEYEFERKRYGSNPEQLRLLAEWLLEQEAEEVVCAAKRPAHGDDCDCEVPSPKTASEPPDSRSGEDSAEQQKENPNGPARRR
jgi:hypothetical protein